MVYPKKIKKFQSPSGPINSDYSSMGNYSEMSGSMDKPINTRGQKIASGFNSYAPTASVLGSYLIDENSKKANIGGVTIESQGAAIGKGALQGAAAGASIGSAIPGVGTLIGGAVGGIAGGVKGGLDNSKTRKEAFLGMRAMNKELGNQVLQKSTLLGNLANQQASAQRALIPSNYRMFSAKKGGIFPKLQKGGVTPHAVIPSGPLHSEKNNLGTKGLPVVHSETNEKKAEVEREEIIFTKPQTDFIMKYHNELKTNPTDQDYEEFGKLVGIFIDGAKNMNDE